MARKKSPTVKNKNSKNINALKKIEKECEVTMNELNVLLAEIDSLKKENRKCENDKNRIKDDEWKKNREECGNRIKQVNQYFEDEIDKLESKLYIHQRREEDYRRMLKDNGIFI